MPQLKHFYSRARDINPPPASVDYSPKAAAALARMYLNDTLGDCVIAGKAHNVGIRTGNESGTPAQFADSDIQSFYERVCGAGDQGCDIAAVLDEEKNNGFLGHKSDGYTAVDNGNQNMVKVAIDLFGCLTIGVNLTDDCTDAGPWRCLELQRQHCRWP